MPLSEAEIIRATQAFMERRGIPDMTYVIKGNVFPIDTLSILLEYEEKMRQLHEEAGQ